MKDWHKKPPETVRSVSDAMISAERRRNDLPHVAQVHAYDWDTVILADAFYQSEAARKVAEEALRVEKVVVTGRIQALNKTVNRTALAESRVRELEVVLTRMCDLIGREDEVRTPWLDDALEAARAAMKKGST